MKDYISREELLKCQFEFYSHGTHCYEKAVYADVIKSFPAADVAPVVHGEWVFDENDYDDLTYSCSICGEPWTLIDGSPQDNKMHYCPNCGAKMRKDDVDNG